MNAVMLGILGLLACPAAAFAAEPPKNFVLHAEARPVPDVRFEDEHGQQRRLAEFRGRMVLLNVWATWCVPCRDEMPTLDRLQARLGGPAFAVVALSVDRGGMRAVEKFFGEIGVRSLATYVDPTGKAARELGTVGLPATLLVDREGREIGRLTGPAAWDSPEMLSFIRDRLSTSGAQHGRPARPAQHPSAAHAATIEGTNP